MNILYRQRSFSDKFSVVFDWFGKNWKQALKGLVWFVLPICAFQAYFQIAVSSYSFSGSSDMASLKAMSGSMGFYYLMGLLGVLMATSVLFALFKFSFFSHTDLKTLTPATLWAGMKSILGRLLTFGLFMFIFISVFAVIIVLLALASKWTMAITIPLLLFMGYALTPLLPLYLFTDEPLFEAIGHSFRLGKSCWWGFFSTSLVMGILVSMVQMVVALPFYLLMQSGNLFGVSGIGIQVATYVYCLLMLLFNYLMLTLSTLIVVVQYGHSLNKIEGVGEEDVL